MPAVHPPKKHPKNTVAMYKTAAAGHSTDTTRATPWRCNSAMHQRCQRCHGKSANVPRHPPLPGTTPNQHQKPHRHNAGNPLNAVVTYHGRRPTSNSAARRRMRWAGRSASPAGTWTHGCGEMETNTRNGTPGEHPGWACQMGRGRMWWCGGVVVWWCGGLVV